MQQNKDYGELFCQAIDEIVKKRLEGVTYDQTILCTIVDDSAREKGIYTVTNNGTTKFDAFSTDTSYRNNNNVYVQIPGGDWNQQKIIVAKKTDKSDEPYVYKKPFASLVDITGNLISSNINSNETGLIANAFDPNIANDPEKDKYDDQYQAITLWTYNVNKTEALRREEGTPHSGYTRLGLQASFQSWLNPFYIVSNANSSEEEKIEASAPRTVISGDYGLRMRITAIDETTTKDAQGKTSYYDLYLNCADMNGNPYDFQSFYTQEKVFDISAIEKITAIELQFYQTAGTFKDKDGQSIPYQDFLRHYIKPNLYVKDVYVSLGYDANEFNEEMVQIYTLDSTAYSRMASPLTNNHKQVQLRWIHKQEDGSFKSITMSDSDMDYEVRWYRYELGHSSADAYSGIYWKNLSKQETIQGTSSYNILDEDWEIYNKTCTAGFRRDPGFFSTWLIPDTTLQEEQIKAIIIYKNQPYRSNILSCRNDYEVVSKPTVDAVQALSIQCVDGVTAEGEPISTFGNYRIYNQGNSLLDAAQANIPRKWVPYFKSSAGGLDVSPSELIEAESIEWIIPTNKTMIVIDGFPEPTANADGTDGVNAQYKEGKLYQRYWYDSNDDKRLHIIRYGGGVKGNEIAQYNFQSYRIKSYYSQTYSDNTIQCKIIKDKITYTATKELTFGVAGTTGTDCTFILDFDNGITAVTNNATDAVTVTARLYDYENNEIELKNYPITWGWKVNDGLLIDEEIGSETNFRREIKRDTSKEWTGPSYNILKASVVWGNTTLETYLPIPIRTSNIQAYISGTTQIIYNSAGELLDYFKNPYILYGSDTKEIAVAEWKCINGYESTDAEITTDERAYTPKIKKDNKTGEQYLTPLSFYVAGACEKVCVIGKDSDDTILWSQPLLIMQNRYPSAMVNSWDGNLNIGGSDGQSIFAPRFVAGKKETDNTFSGVMLGNWSDTVSDNSLTQGDTGLYGYDKGEQSYAFKQDGTAFIGKSGKGRIYFNGDDGRIYSSTWIGDTPKGMLIDLDDGIIEMQSPTTATTAGSITIDATAAEKVLTIGDKFWVKWDGTLHAQDGEFEGTIDADKGDIGAWKINEYGLFAGGTQENGSDATAKLYASGILKMGSGFSSTTIDSTGIQMGSGAGAISIGDGTITMGNKNAWNKIVIDAISGVTIGKEYGQIQISNGSIQLGYGNMASYWSSSGIRLGTFSDSTYISSSGMYIKTINIYSDIKTGSGGTGVAGTSAGSLQYVESDYGTESALTGYAGIGLVSGTQMLKVTQAHIGATNGTSTWVIDTNGFSASYKKDNSTNNYIKITSTGVEIKPSIITSTLTTSNLTVSSGGTVSGVYATLA